ncbi:MAG: TIGR01777 family oxidoreductase [bacterium]
MEIVVSGSTGLIGSALVDLLTENGHHVKRLVRAKGQGEETEVRWNIADKVLDAKAMEGANAVVHLAGENIAARWTAAKKRKISDSRVNSTQLLSEALADMTRPPEVLVCASAIGYYGDRGEEILTEKSGPGSGFLAEVCQAWEGATRPAAAKGIRVVHVRIGVVLSDRGGALAKMLTPFKVGLGGIIGSGSQYWSWICLEDVVGAMLHTITSEAVRGPVNFVSPNPTTNLEFTKILGKVLSRPTLLPLPAFAARLVLGEMAEVLLLASTRVQPKKLTESGYRFLYPDLQTCLRYLLIKNGK